jgi:DNA-binding transcriptional ArsR family regulator
MANQSATLDGVFHALADPTRRAVVSRLSEGHASVSELARPFDMALPSFVQHIKVLEQSGLVRTEKVGRVRICQMAADSIKTAEQWLAEQRAFWETSLDDLEAHLAAGLSGRGASGSEGEPDE